MNKIIRLKELRRAKSYSNSDIMEQIFFRKVIEDVTKDKQADDETDMMINIPSRRKRDRSRENSRKGVSDTETEDFWDEISNSDEEGSSSLSSESKSFEDRKAMSQEREDEPESLIPLFNHTLCF